MTPTPILPGRITQILPGKHVPLFLIFILIALTRIQREAEVADHDIASSEASFSTGATASWTVIEVLSTHIRLSLGTSKELSSDASVQGILHISNAVSDSISYDDILKEGGKHPPATNKRQPLGPLHPFAGIKKGAILVCSVLGTRQDGRKQSVFLTKADTDQPSKSLLQWRGVHGVKENHLYTAVVTSISPCFLSLSLSPYISVSLSFLDISSDMEVIKHAKNNCYVGQKVVVGVVEVDSFKKTLVVSRTRIEHLLHNEENKAQSSVHTGSVVFAEKTALQAGSKVAGLLQFSGKAPHPPSFAVVLPEHRRGRVCITEFADPKDWIDAVGNGQGGFSSFGGYRDGDLVTCVVLENDDSRSSSHCDLSLRPSRLAAKKKSAACMDDPIPSVGDIVPAYVNVTSNKGCFLRLSRNTSGRVLIKNLADEFVSSPSEAFPSGKLVQACVTQIQDGLIELSLRRSDVFPQASTLELASIKVGDILPGVVQKVVEFGVFVSVEGVKVVGLSRSMHAVARGQNILERFSVGDVVRAKVLDITGGKLSLGLSEKYFRNTDDPDATSDEDDEVDDGISEDNDGGEGEAEEERSSINGGIAEIEEEELADEASPEDLPEEEMEEKEEEEERTGSDPSVLKQKGEKRPRIGEATLTHALESTEPMLWDDFQPTSVFQ